MSYGQNYNIFNDLNELERMIQSLPGYLQGRELYGSIGGGIFTGGGAPNLTVGVILMRLRRIKLMHDRLDERRQKAFEQARTEHDAIRAEHSDAYTDKIEREAHSRLDAMDRFFEECREDPAACPRIYSPEAFRRTVVQELIDDLAANQIHSEDLSSKLRATDKRLRRLVTEADFQWDEQLAPAYPQAVYWWLWAAPPAVR